MLHSLKSDAIYFFQIGCNFFLFFSQLQKYRYYTNNCKRNNTLLDEKLIFFVNVKCQVYTQFDGRGCTITFSEINLDL